MNIIVTGCAGFIGSNLCEKILLHNHKVIGIDNFDEFYLKSKKKNNVKKIINHDNFKFINIDLDKISNLKLDGDIIDVIIHLAASPGVRYSFEKTSHCLYNNINVTQKILDFSVKNKIKKFLFASSSSVYGQNKNLPWNEKENLSPISPYAFSKLSCESLGKMYSEIDKISFISLRFFTVYGPRQRPDLAIYKFFNCIINNKTISVYGDGKTYRDYTYIDDIINGVFNSIKIKSKFEIINLGNNRPIGILNLIKKIEKITKKKAKIEFLPLPKGDVPATYADIKKANKLFGFSPKIDIIKGLKLFYEWYLKNH